MAHVLGSGNYSVLALWFGKGSESQVRGSQVGQILVLRLYSLEGVYQRDYMNVGGKVCGHLFVCLPNFLQKAVQSLPVIANLDSAWKNRKASHQDLYRHQVLKDVNDTSHGMCMWGPAVRTGRTMSRKGEEPGLWEQDTQSLWGAALMRFLLNVVT